MTIGPAPMMRIDLMSVRLGIRSARLFHQVHESLKEVVAVLRAGAGLGVVLHGEDRLALDPQALVAAVEERDMCRLDVLRQALGDDAEAVVLAGDLDLAGLDVLDGMIGAAVTDRHFLRAPAERETEQLMAEADAEDRLPRLDQGLKRRHRVGTGRRGIAGSVGEENAVGLVREDLLGGRSRGNYRDAAAVGGKEPQDVPLGAVV